MGNKIGIVWDTKWGLLYYSILFFRSPGMRCLQNEYHKFDLCCEFLQDLNSLLSTIEAFLPPKKKIYWSSLNKSVIQGMHYNPQKDLWKARIILKLSSSRKPASLDVLYLSPAIILSDSANLAFNSFPLCSLSPGAVLGTHKAVGHKKELKK